jgi:integrase
MKKKLESLVITCSADKIVKTPEYAFIRLQFSVNNIYCTSKYSTGIKCLVADWNKQTKTIENDEKANQNLQLTIKGVEQRYLTLSETKPHLTAKELYLDLNGKTAFGTNAKAKPEVSQMLILHTVLEVLEWYEIQKRPMGSTHANNNYETHLNFWHKYLKNNKLINLRVDKLPANFLNEFYDKVIAKYKHNYLLILCGFFRAAFTAATDKQLIPYTHLQKSNKGGFEATRTEEYLSAAEYDKLKNFEFEGKRYSKKIRIEARDVYVFMCETGFCYADYMTFDYDLHVKSHKDMEVFCKKRHKLRNAKNERKVSQRGLLTETAKAILAKYDNKLPKIEYSSFLKRLKKVAKIIGLPSFIGRSHSARHSSGMLLLNEGLSIQNIQPFMGHASIKTTESIYVIAETEKVAEAMRRVKKD